MPSALPREGSHDLNLLNAVHALVAAFHHVKVQHMPSRSCKRSGLSKSLDLCLDSVVERHAPTLRGKGWFDSIDRQTAYTLRENVRSKIDEMAHTNKNIYVYN